MVGAGETRAHVAAAAFISVLKDDKP